MKTIMILVLNLITIEIASAGINEYRQKPKHAEGKKEIKIINDKIVKMRLGMDFGLRFQSLEHENNGTSPISKIKPGFTNANGNLNADIQLAEGMSTYIEIYLSSEHHKEVYMKEGYMFIDSLGFLENNKLDSLMNVLSVKAGQMEINYGDYHFRRTDNGRVHTNPFIGNYLIDSNTTEIATEFMLDFKLLEFLVGFSGGTTKGDTQEDHGFAKYGKLALNHEFGGNKRLRVSGSYYTVDHSKNGPSSAPTFSGTKNYLYSGNRSGSPYQGLFGASTDAGQILPEISQDMYAYMINLLFKINSFELFATYDVANENDKNGSADAIKLGEEWEHYAVEVKNNFTEKFYLAARFNVAKHNESNSTASDQKVKMVQLAAGYHLTDAILMKLEYMQQKYKNFSTGKTAGGKADGVIAEFSVNF